MRWEEGGQRLQLVGQRCSACNTYYFPRTARCKACGSGDLAEALLGPEGELHSITVDRTGTFLGRPHLVGQARFPEGPFVQGFVAAEIEAAPAIGSAIELVPFEVPAPEGDGALLTYGFAPKEAW
jgi:uncharacterized OB-fold protein